MTYILPTKSSGDKILSNLWNTSASASNSVYGAISASNVGIAGALIDSGKRIAGIRIATEFDTAKHAGTDADPWSGAAIQAAIDDVPASGGMIYLPAGVWAPSTVIVPKSNLRILGSGGATILKPTGTAFSGNSGGIFRPSADISDLEIGHMAIDSTGNANQVSFYANQTGGATSIKDCWIHDIVHTGKLATEDRTFNLFNAPDMEGTIFERVKNYGSKLLHADQIKSLDLINCKAIMSPSAFLDAVYLSSTDRVRLIGCLIRGYTHNGLANFNASKRTQVLGCRFEYCADGIDQDGAAETVTIVGNVFYNCGGGGDGSISFTPLSGRVLGATITGNTFLNTDDQLDPILANNIDNLVIDGNVFIQGSAPQSTSFVVLSGCNDVLVEANEWYFPGGGSVLNPTLGITDSKKVRVLGNDFYGGPDTNGHMLRITSSTPGATNDVVIENNTFTPNFSGLAGRESIGIALADEKATNVRIEKNTFYQTSAALAISISNPPSLLIIKGNIGYKTEVSVLSPDFFVDATGVKTVTIAHGLAARPREEDCDISVVM